MRCVRKPCRICEHYRERMSECRNCETSDMPYKECFLKKLHNKDPLHSEIFKRGIEK